MTSLHPARIAGAALVAIGGLWLLRSLGFVTAVPVGPILLVAVGTTIIVTALRAQPVEGAGRPAGAAAGTSGEPIEWSADRASGGAQATTLAPSRLVVPIETATRARLVLQHGAGTIRLHRGAPEGAVCEVVAEDDVEHRIRRHGEHVEVEVRPAGQVAGVLSRLRPVTWDVALAEGVALDIEIATGASAVTGDLTGLDVERLAVRTGASDIDLVLPDRGRCATYVSAGAADVTLRVPHGVAAAIRNRSALASFSVDERRFPRAGRDHRSPDFDDAEVRAEIDVEGGVASFTIR